MTSQSAGSEIGLVAFSGLAAVIQPPTNDQQAPRRRDPSLTTGRRTAIGSGILASIDAIAEVDPNVARAIIPGRPGVEPDPVVKGAYVPDIVVLLTDGANNAGTARRSTPPSRRPTAGVRVYTIGFGTAVGGELDAELPPAVHRQRAGNAAASGSAAAGSAVAAAAGSGAGSTRTRCKPVADTDRRRVLPGRERQRARAGVPRPADHDHHQVRAGRGQRRVRGPGRRCSRRWPCSSAAPGARCPKVRGSARAACRRHAAPSRVSRPCRCGRTIGASDDRLVDAPSMTSESKTFAAGNGPIRADRVAIRPTSSASAATVSPTATTATLDSPWRVARKPGTRPRPGVWRIHSMPTTTTPGRHRPGESGRSRTSASGTGVHSRMVDGLTRLASPQAMPPRHDFWPQGPLQGVQLRDPCPAGMAGLVEGRRASARKR